MHHERDEGFTIMVWNRKLTTPLLFAFLKTTVSYESLVISTYYPRHALCNFIILGSRHADYDEKDIPLLLAIMPGSDCLHAIFTGSSFRRYHRNLNRWRSLLRTLLS